MDILKNSFNMKLSEAMRWLVIGDGIQGRKRKQILGKKCVGVLDPYSKTADFASIEDVPQNYDVAAICTSQDAKLHYLTYFIDQRIPCLIEKPFPVIPHMEFERLNAECLSKGIFVYTAFNHRFEESLNKLSEILGKDLLGVPYYIHMRYGNGTVQDVLNSNWKNSKDGLLFDLGSHIFDLYTMQFGTNMTNLTIEQTAGFESLSSDYMRISGKNVLIELGYIFWKSDFRFEIWGSKGSVHVTGLKKWDNSQLVLRQRVLPSGVPVETLYKFSGPDTTWNQEHQYVEHQINHNSKGIDFRGQGVNETILGLVNR